MSSAPVDHSCGYLYCPLSNVEYNRRECDELDQVKKEFEARSSGRGEWCVSVSTSSQEDCAWFEYLKKQFHKILAHSIIFFIKGPSWNPV